MGEAAGTEDGLSKEEHLSNGSGPEYPEQAPYMLSGERHQNI